jgi:predicted O-methyltransferase YrrM
VNAESILAQAAAEFDPKARTRDHATRSLVWLAKRLRGKSDVIDVVAVGVGDGRLAATILGNVPQARLSAVDTWSGGLSPRDPRKALDRAGWRKLREIAAAHLRPFRKRLTVLEVSSSEAAGNYSDESVDLVVIDGARMQLADDLDHWWRTVCEGGAIAGTNYGSRRHGLVKVAVDALAYAHGLEVETLRGKVWVLRKPKTTSR